MRFIRSLWQSTFLRHNAIFFTGSVAVGALNYLYYPVIGRLLQPATFGEVQALVSLFLQLTIFLNVFSMVTVNIIANYKNTAKAHQVVYELEKTALAVSGAALLLAVIFSEQLKSAFQFGSTLPFILLAIALVVTVPFMFRSAYLRGVKRFGQTSVANIWSAAGKLLFSVVFVIAGFGTAGAIGGLIAAQIVALIYAATRARKAGLQPSPKYWSWPHMPSILPELKYALLVFIGSFIITMLFSVDVLIVKYLFDAETAGHYAGVATVARIVYFLTASVAQVLLPSVKLQQPPEKNRAILLKSLALVVTISAPVVVVCALFPRATIELLMGANYLPLASVLPLLTLAIFFISIANVIVLYYIALRRWAVAGIVIIDAVVAGALMMANNATPQAIVDNLFIASIVLMLLLGTWMLTLIINDKRRV